MGNNRLVVGEQWVKYLRVGGYEHHVLNARECRKIKRFSRIWRRIFRATGLPLASERERNVFEVGCGGGRHLAPFAMNGWRTEGVDISPEVLLRAEKYVEEISLICGLTKPNKFVVGDFFEYEPGECFDLVFHVGVIEHFLDATSRHEMLTRMISITKPGGFIVSIVPNGIHPIREKMKRLKLGGYNIPEIDYSPDLMRTELQKIGGVNIQILPHDLFGYFLFDTGNYGTRLFKKLLYFIFQVVPVHYFDRNLSFLNAGTLIGIAKKA